MIALFKLHLPFRFLVPADEQFTEIAFPPEPYEVSVVGLAASDSLSKWKMTCTIDQAPARAVDTLLVKFKHTGDFAVRLDTDFMQRRVEPSAEQAMHIANLFLQRLRVICGNQYVEWLSPSNTSWGLQYFTDQMYPVLSEITGAPEDDWRPVGAVTNDDWLAAAPSAPGRVFLWQNLVLEARNRISEPFVAVVLADTAMEVLARGVIELLCYARKIPVPTIPKGQDRTQFRFDVGLKEVAGVSLKERNPVEWAALSRLSALRNDLIHQGRISDAHPLPTEQELIDLIESARKVIRLVQPLLPRELSLPWAPPRNAQTIVDRTDLVERQTHVPYLRPRV